MDIQQMTVAFILTLSISGLSTPVSAATSSAPVSSEFLTPVESEAKVRTYFKDIPVMIEIARCESQFRQYTDGGSVLRGGSGGGMIGIFQFFENIHATAATTLGFDLATLDGNLGYAKHVYESEGTAPWNSAKQCWETPDIAINATHKEKLKQQIIILTKLITLLQKQIAAEKTRV